MCFRLLSVLCPKDCRLLGTVFAIVMVPWSPGTQALLAPGPGDLVCVLCVGSRHLPALRCSWRVQGWSGATVATSVRKAAEDGLGWAWPLASAMLQESAVSVHVCVCPRVCTHTRAGRSGASQREGARSLCAAHASRREGECRTGAHL